MTTVVGGVEKTMMAEDSSPEMVANALKLAQRLAHSGTKVHGPWCTVFSGILQLMATGGSSGTHVQLPVVVGYCIVYTFHPSLPPSLPPMTTCTINC